MQAVMRGERSRSKSPGFSSNSDGPFRASELLQQCITLIASIIVEDCRFQTSSPKLTRPPNALQAVTLDVVQYLIHAHREDPKILAQVAIAVIPAFYAFKPDMHARLLAFFDDGLLGIVLEDLGYSQRQNSVLPDAPCNAYFIWYNWSNY